ncbi:O-antigen ligase family protein [uncultured Rhodoblastus sp.]|uniref:O-antigen ligase family protein n=1 Tax=uncultured Rhodoblastus sp. TaxID=543037 RepID=UPI0025D6095B|nr:O-antigen ligase family protein [uncultured Rhodoblastus sp.]
MDFNSLGLRIRDRLQPSNVSATIKSAIAALKILLFRAWTRWNKPAFKFGVLRTIGWALFATLYGLIVGAASVLLPPMAPIGLVALSAPVLFWALPDLPTIPAASLRRAFFLTVAVEITIPTYYMVQISGIPWISIRRVMVLILVLLTLYSISVSRDERRSLSKVLSDQYWLSFCIIGYLFMAFVSIFFSKEPTQSIGQFFEYFLNWYLPFFACLIVIRSEKDVILLYKIVAILSLFVAALGIVDFITHHNWAVEVIPRSLLNKMMRDNPSVAGVVNSNPFRNGQYRASSIYNVPLCYGEFAAMVAPIGLYFILHTRNMRDRLLGVAVLVGAMLSLFVSGARGGNVAFLISVPLLLGLWVVRYSALNPRSVVGPLFATASAMCIAALFALILTWRRLHNIVLGGGDTASSDDSRNIQWQLGWPHILSNPITGHGIGRAAETVNYHTPAGAMSIDSYVLSVVVETGVPGLLLYFGMIFVAAAMLIRIYLRDKDPAAEISAPVACSLIAYGVYRLVLSQRENQTLFFILLGITFVIAESSAKRMAKKAKVSASINSGAPRIQMASEPHRQPTSRLPF